MPSLSRRELLAAASTAALAAPMTRAWAQRPVSLTVAYAYPQIVQATLQTLAEQFMQRRPASRCKGRSRATTSSCRARCAAS
jgi:hypothetical protein